MKLYQSFIEKTRSEEQRVVKILRYVARIGAAFAFILSVLILVNFIQIKRIDPLNIKVMKSMVDRLHANPEDAALQQEIREVDLMARKAFFTSQWQVRMGGYLLFFSLLTVVICLKSIELIQSVRPQSPSGDSSEWWNMRKTGSAWVAYTGIFVVLFSLIIAFLTHRELGKNLDAALGIPPEGVLSARNNGVNPDTLSVAAAPSTIADSTLRDTLTEGLAAGGGTAEGFPTAQENISNFPSFRGPGGLGIDYHQNIPTSWDGNSGKNIRWKTAVPLPGYNSPIIWGDKIFLSGADERRRAVYCFDLKTGQILWQTPVEKIAGTPSQEPKVIRETGFSASGMTTDGRRVYAIFANGDLIALDFNGKAVWSKNLGLPKNHYGYASSLIIYRDLLIVQYDQRGSGSVMSFSGKNGDMVWQTSRNVKISWASPVVAQTAKRTELILAADPVVASYNPADGKELWNLACISGEVGPSVAYSNGVVFSVNDFSKVSAIKIGETPELLWEDSDYLSDIPSPVATEKYLFLVTSYGAMVCYDARNGTKYWEQELETQVFASPMISDGKIYLLDKKGVMHIIKPDQSYSVIAQPPLGEGSSCTPAFANGTIVIRGDKHLFCIGK